MLGVKRGVGGEKGCLGRKWAAFRCLGVKGVFGAVKMCQRHNEVVWGANEVLAMG